MFRPISHQIQSSTRLQNFLDVLSSIFVLLLGPVNLFRGQMSEWSHFLQHLPPKFHKLFFPIVFLDASFRGAGQVQNKPFSLFLKILINLLWKVCFQNNPASGLIILAALFIGDIWVAILGTLALLVSTFTSVLIGNINFKYNLTNKCLIISF